MKLLYTFLFIITLIVQNPSFAQEASQDNTTTPSIITNQKVTQKLDRKIIKVAVVLPLRGANKDTGKRLLNSLYIIKKLVQDPRNDTYFGSQFKFQLIVKNENCTIQNAQNIARNIIAAKDIFFVIGHFCSKGSLAAAPIYDKAGIIQITPFSTETSLTEQGYRTFFRLAGRSDRYAEVTAKWLYEMKQYEKLATIYGDNTYGRPLVKNTIINLELEAQVSDEKIQDTYYRESIDFQQYSNNISALVDKLIKDKVTLVYYAGYYTHLANIIKEVKRRQANIRFFASGSSQNYDFWRQSDGQADGVFFAFTQDFMRDISQEDENLIKQRIKFNKLKQEKGFEAAIRKYGIQSSRSFFPANRIYKNRVDFIKAYFEKCKMPKFENLPKEECNTFPDAYMAHIYAAFEIIKIIATDEMFIDIFRNQQEIQTEIQVKALGLEIARYIKDKGYNTSDEYVGFPTIVGPVNFSETGDWKNANYVIYQWKNKRQRRDWVSEDPDDIGKYVGPMGDYVRLF